MKYTVSERDLSEIRLNEQDVVSSVLQNVAIILKTRQGTVPLYRDFGLSMDYIDKPINVAKTLIAADIDEALSRYEPRASLVDVSFEEDEDNPGRLIPTVEVEIYVEQES